MTIRLGIPPLVRWIGLMALFFVALLSILRWILFIRFPLRGIGSGSLGPSFVLGLRYDLRYVGLLSFAALIIGLLPKCNPFANPRARKTWFILLTIVTAILFLFYTVDFAHFAYLHQRLNASALNYLQDAKISGNMVWQTYPVIRVLLALLLLILGVRYVLKKLFRYADSYSATVTRKSRIISFALFLSCTALAIFGRIGQFPLRWSDAFGLGNDYAANLALNPMESFFNTLNYRNLSYDAKKVKAYYPLMAGYLNISAVQKDSAPAFERSIMPRPTLFREPPNIVLVICESFSAYKSSMWGNKLNTTPFFNSICQQGIFFDRCFTPAYGTARGVWATLTGIPDVQPTQTASRNPSIVDQHILINHFKGYQKYYFMGGSTSWANIRGLISNNIHGLHVYEQENFDAPKVDVWGISDKNLFLQANGILKQEKTPFFAVIQTADNHRPYTIPEEDRSSFPLLSFPADTLHKYGFESNEEMNAFRYTDFCFRIFLEAAGKEAFFNNTIFVFVGDHGIPGDVGNLFPRPWTDFRLANMHVPLLFYSPANIPAQRYGQICSQVDVLPTLAGICGIPYTTAALGRDLLDSTLFNHPEKQFAFIFDAEMKTMGVARGAFFYRKQINGPRDNFVSIINNEPVVVNDSTTRIRGELKQLAEGVYESSLFMLYNNRKKE